MCVTPLWLQILKQEWPHNWKDFIPQIVESGKTNETLCGNNMDILKKLSEEVRRCQLLTKYRLIMHAVQVFEFSLKQLTSRKVDQLKESLTQARAMISFVTERFFTLALWSILCSYRGTQRSRMIDQFLFVVDTGVPINLPALRIRDGER